MTEGMKASQQAKGQDGGGRIWVKRQKEAERDVGREDSDRLWKQQNMSMSDDDADEEGNTSR